MENEEVFIIIPCYNEAVSIVKLLGEIEELLKNSTVKCTAVVVDDCSTDDTLSLLAAIKSDGKLNLRVIALHYNLGHQAAIAQGLLFANQNGAAHAIVMDGDGEDDPGAITELLSLRNHDIVHVVRGKRSESFGFRLAYGFYKIFFRMITKKKMNFGNYCMISRRIISILSVRTFIHFAAFLSKLQFNSVLISSNRRKRIDGRSKMSLPLLVHHAFRSFAEYGEAMLMIFLRLFVILFLFFIITIGYIVYLKIFTDYPIIGWTSTFGVGLLTAALLCMGFFVTGVLLLNLTQYRANLPPMILYKVLR